MSAKPGDELLLATHKRRFTRQYVVWSGVCHSDWPIHKIDPCCSVNRKNLPGLERHCILSRIAEKQHTTTDTPCLFFLWRGNIAIFTVLFGRSRRCCASINNTHQINVLKQCQHVWHHFTGEGRWSDQIHETRDVLDCGCPHFCFVVLKKAEKGYTKQNAKQKV